MKKVLACFLAASFIAVVFAGCGSSSSPEAETSAKAGTETPSAANYSNTTVTGKVTAIDGSSVTLQLGKFTEGQQGDAPSGEAPSGEAPSGDAPSGEAPSGDAPSGDAPSGDAPSGDAPSGDAPSGDAPSGDAPSGNAPSGDAPSGDAPSGEAPSGGGAMSSFTAGTESVTFTISGDTAVTVDNMGQSTDGSISDIAAGEILEVTFGGDGTVTAVTIKTVGGPGGTGSSGSSGSDGTSDNG